MTTWKASSLRPSALFGAIRGIKGSNIGVPLGAIRGSTGLVTTATPADNVWAYKFATNVQTLVSNTADGGTKTALGTFRLKLPETFVNSQSLVLRIRTKLVSVTGTGVADNASSIDLSVYKQSDGVVGADLCITAAQVYAALDTWYAKEFTIDAGNLAAGDELNFLVTGTAIESDAGNGTLQNTIEEITLIVGDPS